MMKITLVVLLMAVVMVSGAPRLKDVLDSHLDSIVSRSLDRDGEGDALLAVGSIKAKLDDFSTKM